VVCHGLKCLEEVTELTIVMRGVYDREDEDCVSFDEAETFA
jgi:dTDP-4-dehydrorhamnose 3,5-epimerase-like enzyme